MSRVLHDKAFYNRTSSAIADYLWQQLEIHPQRGDYRLLSATSGPRVLTLGLLINPSLAPKVIKLAEQMSMAAGLDRAVSIRVARGNRGTLALEIPKPKDLWYDIGVRSLPNGRGLRAPVGIDVEHRPALLDFGNPLTPHLLASGTTGCGKTNTARLFAYDLATGNRPEDVSLILVDTRKRGIAWRSFENLPHLAHPVITDDATALRALGWAIAELDRRCLQRRNTPRVFLAIDEAQALLDRPEFVGPIGELAAVGRECGIHLFLATQNPTAEMLGSTNIKRNLTMRLVGKVDSAQAAVVSAGIKATGAELLTGPGDQLLIAPSGVTRITIALVTENDLLTLPRTESHQELELGQYDDIDHVVDQAAVNVPAPIEPAHLATALANRRGINWLASQLRIGTKRATRLRTYADQVLEALAELDHTIIPHARDTSSAGVTGTMAAEGV